MTLAVANELAGTAYVELVPPPKITTWTLAFWAQILESGATDGYAMQLRGEPIVGAPCFHILSLYRDGDGDLFARWEDPCEVIDTVEAFDESPPIGTWVFVAITFDDAEAVLRWCEPCDEAFTAARTATLTVQPMTSTFLRLANSIGGGGANGFGGAVALARQWTRVLTDTELHAEQLSATAVEPFADLWASNPLQGITDTSDESGNDNLATISEMTQQSGPTLCAAEPVCDEIGRATRAYVSAYDRTRVQAVQLYARERRCLIANFNGTFPKARSIVAATWRIDSPQVGVIASPTISEDGREARVMLLAQLCGWATVKCQVTLDNDEVYNQVFRLQVREASWFNDETSVASGPYSVTVAA